MHLQPRKQITSWTASKVGPSRLKDVVLPISSSFMGPHLEFSTQLWGPQHRKYMHLLET